MKTVQKKLNEIAEIKAKFEILTDVQQAKVNEEEKLKQEAKEIQAKLDNIIHVIVSCFLVCILLGNTNPALANQIRTSYSNAGPFHWSIM